MGECRTTANPQRAPGFCWLQDFHCQTNERLFQCRLAVELLLLLKPPPKYHSFHKTVLQLQPARSSVHFSHCAPGLGTPKLSVQYSGTPQLWRGLFFPSSMNHQWWHKVSPTGIMVQVGAVIPWELNSGSWCHQGKELQQPWSSSLCGGEQSVPQRGRWGKGLTQFMLCREEGRDHSCHLFFSFFHHLHFLLGKILVNNWIPEIEEWFHTHTHQEDHFLFLNITHHWFAFWSDWFCPPSPKEAVPAPSCVRLFYLAEMQGRKEKGVSCFLPFVFKVSQPDYCSSCSEEKTEFIAFVSQLAQFSCFFQCHRTPLMNTNTLSSQKDRDSKIHYLQEIGGSCYKFCAR